MSKRKPKSSIKKKPPQALKIQGDVTVKGTARSGKKIVVTTSDKNAQVLAATVGGAVLGNLIVPGIGGAIVGGLVGALLGNDSRSKGGK